MTSATRTTDVISIRQRVLPQPLFSLVLLAVWLLAQGKLELSTIIGGVVLALVLPALTYRFTDSFPKVRRLRPLIQYVVIVMWDILVANLVVARLILGSSRKLKPTFLEVPVKLTNPYAITIFAATISLTPGTVSSNLSGDRKTLLVHALTSDDPDAEIQLMKARYEAPLLEAFQ
ncbi:Na+/H+ antiporter subunit E [Bradymonadaceae bacterium TMQ3]|uniref:Na+/H+ antiporter subunit E n=1 Tax=Lujinxingia sediminis TaxID=2480984 RepID=A0ABY0CRI3_9DELT|nr:Na+/H+ antiporter subunit E [Bradymonadaceae bacterium TMQ3]RVU43196.1 Na+/H+ antiporter subunit E [Lujinxingia sediminis]TXC75425.1 Na+/H+ antiporter subunit E [Bradymonadales bacterium TMQ1]